MLQPQQNLGARKTIHWIEIMRMPRAFKNDLALASCGNAVGSRRLFPHYCCFDRFGRIQCPVRRSGEQLADDIMLLHRADTPQTEGLAINVVKSSPLSGEKESSRCGNNSNLAQLARVCTFVQLSSWLSVAVVYREDKESSFFYRV